MKKPEGLPSGKKSPIGGPPKANEPTVVLPNHREPAIERLLIVGAGDSGAELCRQALRRQEFHRKPVAFADDDPRKIGTSILGVPIAGRCPDIPKIVEKYGVDVAIIAIPSASDSEKLRLGQLCRRSGVPFNILSAVPEFPDNTVSIARMRRLPSPSRNVRLAPANAAISVNVWFRSR